jgi:catechol 2,3-dioxygenase-like lactoylglutathione lyase family enzyme
MTLKSRLLHYHIVRQYYWWQVFDGRKEHIMGFRINHLHLKSPDTQQTVDFYVKYCGATIKSERTGPNGRKNFRLNLHGVELNVTDFLEEQKLGQFYGLEHVAIDAEDFDGEVAKIKGAGVKILEERVLPDGRRVCFFEGPQGVRLEFLEMK